MEVQGFMPTSFIASLGIEPEANAILPHKLMIRLSDGFVTIPTKFTDLRK